MDQRMTTRVGMAENPSTVPARIESIPQRGGPRTVEERQAVVALAIKLDKLHGELRRAERQNEALRLELLHYRMSEEEEPRALPGRRDDPNLRARLHEEAEACRRAQMSAATQMEARQRAEEAAAQHAELARQAAERARQAELRAESADKEAELSRLNANLLREQLEKQQRPWWKKFLGQR